jgi:Anti-sigma-28 factor, FlgM
MAAIVGGFPSKTYRRCGNPPEFRAFGGVTMNPIGGQELQMNPKDQGTPLSDDDRERLSMIKKAIFAGTYQVSADDVAAKLVLSMLEFCDDSSSAEASSSRETETAGSTSGRKEGLISKYYRCCSIRHLPKSAYAVRSVARLSCRPCWSRTRLGSRPDRCKRIQHPGPV